MTDEPDPTASKGYQLTDTAEVELEDILRFVADRDGVQRALGRPPRDFADFARAAARSGAWTAAT